MALTSPPGGDSGVRTKLASIPSGRRSKWLIVLLWVVILAVASPLAGKLTSVEDNDTATWLPQNAESLAVATAEEEISAGDQMPAVIVYHRDGGLLASDHEAIEADRQALSDLFPSTPPSPAIPSEDGQAVIFTVPLAVAEDEDLANGVDAIRAQVHDAPDGLQVKVTGPAGFTMDLANVFSGVDTTLLLATAGVVAALLLLTYRSPFLWLIPLLSVAFAHQLAGATVYGLAKSVGLTLNGQSGGILPVLVFGAGTDYALLLIARYREELRRHEDKHEAMAFALRQAGPAIVASGATVVVGLLCLLAADLNPTRSLGPVGAAGIVAALLAMLTLLPALLVIFGRRLFWPFIPHFGSASHEASGIWSRVGGWVARRPRPVWITTVALLAILASGLLGIDTNLPQENQFRNEPEAISGQKLIAESFPAGSGAPATIITSAAAADAVSAAASDVSGVALVEPCGGDADRAVLAATLTAEPGSQAAFDTIDRLRDAVHAVPEANAIVGGNDAISLDIARASERDSAVIMPLILLIVVVILAVLLRSIVAPLVLLGTVVLSFAAALGTSVVVFDRVFGFAGMDPSTPLLAFVFLIALGIDYNIFLMGRVHEEAAQIGTRAGMLRGLAVTGGVITSAGLVLAATFAVLGVLPLVSMTELGFIVAFGVLLDTLIVRSILVPALTFDIGPTIWWPSRLAQPEAVVSRPAPGLQPLEAIEQ